MSADLGARLQRAGLITREQLAETMAIAPLHGSAFVRALSRTGVSEDAIVGYFIAEGLGPLMGAADLAAADPALAARVPASVLREFAVLPLRVVDAGGGELPTWIVAMVAPTERHVVAELERIASVKVIPAVARWSELRAALAEVGASEPEEAPASGDAEPPVIELVRRRPSIAPPAETGYGAASARAAAAAKLQLDPEDAVPLVRQKPVTHVSSAPPPAKIVAKTFAAPSPASKRLWGRAPTTPIEVAEEPRTEPPPVPASPTALEIATATAVDALPLASAPVAVAPEPPATQEAAEAAAPGAESPVSDAASSAERPSLRPGVVVPRPSEPYVRRPVTSPPADARPLAPRSKTFAPPARAASAPPPAPAASAPPPAPAASASPPPETAAPAGEPEHLALPTERPQEAEPIAPEESWHVPPADAPAPTRPRPNKLSMRASRELVPMKAPLGDVRGAIVAIRQATDRDDVVRLALDGALQVSRSAVFFALRKGLLKGWDGLGSGVSEDSARNLWIPTSTTSLFQRVVDGGVGYFGAYGNAIADSLFRAAVGSRGGDLSLLPVRVGGKVVGLLACDDVRGGPQGQHRLELVAAAVEEAFARIIVKQKQG